MPVRRPGPEDWIGKIRMVDGIGPPLGLQTEGGAGTIGGVLLARGSVQKVGGVKLQAGLGGEALQTQPASHGPGRASRSGPQDWRWRTKLWS